MLSGFGPVSSGGPYGVGKARTRSALPRRHCLWNGPIVGLIAWRWLFSSSQKIVEKLITYTCDVCRAVYTLMNHTDIPPSVPASFLSSVPLHGMTFPFLSDINPLGTHSSQTSRYFFSQNYSHIFRSVLLSSYASSLCLLPALSCV